MLGNAHEDYLDVEIENCDRRAAVRRRKGT
jgi:hypothetical protein